MRHHSSLSIYPIVVLTLVVVASSCRKRSETVGLTKETAVAEAGPMTTYDRKKLYPSLNMLVAAQEALDKAVSARRRGDGSTFKKHFRVARLQMRMRPTTAEVRRASPQAATKLRCSLQQGDRSISTTVELSDPDAYMWVPESLRVGEYAYNFGGEWELHNNGVYLSIILNENNHVEDEVGSFYCETAQATVGADFCIEPITGLNDTQMRFSCRFL